MSNDLKCIHQGNQNKCKRCKRNAETSKTPPTTRRRHLYPRDPNPVKDYHYLPDYLRAEILDRDKYTCQNFCGYVGKWRDGVLNIHHIDYSGQSKNPNDHPDNLITLCNKCHMKIHHPFGRVRYFPERIYKGWYK